MEFKRTLVRRLFNNISKFTTNPTHITNCRISSSVRIPPNPDKPELDPGNDRITRRFIHRRPDYPSPSTSQELRYLPSGEKLLEKLRGLDIVGNRIRLEGLIPPASRIESPVDGKLTVEDARKVLKLVEMEKVKEKLREIGKNCVAYDEFVRICTDGFSGSGLEFAKILDESGNVVVLGDVVFLRPDQVVKAIQGLMPVPQALPNDPKRKELEQMEQQKSVIEKMAESQVRRELWWGLGYLVVQTAAFMRLTFWELTWDVMEPICFYVTSMYFMGGYAFFLRTSKEPSFEGFFQSRFVTKQKQLMKVHNFDLERYNELRKAFYPPPLPPENALTFASMSVNFQRTT